MLTSEGKLHIKRYLAGYEPDIGRAIAFGVGTAAPALTDTSLQFEIGRSPVTLVTYDFVTDRLIFKATLSEQFDGIISEVGLYSREGSSAGDFGSRLLTSFDSDSEVWMNGGSPAAYTAGGNTRVGNDSVFMSPVANGNATVSYGNITIDLSENSAADVFSFAFHADTHTSSIRYRFLTDTSNYYDITIPTGSITTGFNIVRVTKGSATATGTPNWGLITQIQVTVFAKSTGTVSMNLEAIRIEDTDTIDTGYVLVDRIVLSTPYTKVSGRIQEVEFPLAVSI